MNEVVEHPFANQARAVTETAGARQGQSRELAEMQTKYLMAQQFPRDERKAMDGIINAFSRRGLAERSQYQFSRGGSDIAGPSVHSAQAIAQQWGNIEFGWRETSRGVGADGVPYSEVESFATDLQSRVPSRIAFIVKHWRDTKAGGYKLKDERDIYELCANQAQRRKRAVILSILPQDVVDSAMEQAETTLKANADTSPAAMTKMVDAFAEYGVTKEQIEKRIQRRLDAITSAQVVSLKRIYASLRDEVSTAAEWFDVPKAEPAASGLDAVKEAAAAAKTRKDQKHGAVDQTTGEITAGAGTGAAPPPAKGKPAAVVKILAQFKAQIDNALDQDQAAVILDGARDELDATDLAVLADHYRSNWSN